MHPTLEWQPTQGHAEQLILLLPGPGQQGAAMAPLAGALRRAFAQAAVVVAPAAASLPWLEGWVRAQQERLRVPPAATALGGFGQGAVMAVALVLQQDGLCGRVLAFAGGLNEPPQAAPRHTTLHFFHGGDDVVMPAEGARQALLQLGELQGDATLDIAEGIGHELHPVLIDCALQRLRTHIPLRTWQAALGAAPAARLDD